MKIFRQIVPVFLGGVPKTGTGLSCTIYKIQVNFSLTFNKKPSTSHPNKWYRKFRSFRWKREKGNTSKGITFFPENFHRDEPFHLNSPRNFRVFHTNGKRSRTFILIKWAGKYIKSWNLGTDHTNITPIQRTVSFACAIVDLADLSPASLIVFSLLRRINAS